MSYIDDEELKTGDIEGGFEEEVEEDALEIDDAFIDPLEEDGELLDEVDAEEEDILEEFQELDEDGNY